MFATRIAVILTFLASPAIAANSVQVSTRYGGSATSPTSAEIIGSNHAGFEHAKAEASGANGVLKGSAYAHTIADPAVYIDFQTASAVANSSFADAITLTGRPTGTAGTMNFAFDISGTATSHTVIFTSANASGRAESNVGFTFRAVVNNIVETMSFSMNNNAQASPPIVITSAVNGVPGNAIGVNYFSVPFIFGQQFTISAQLEVSARALTLANFGPSAEAEGVADFGHSAYWGGIQSVVVDGDAVAFSVSSASGTNYLSSLAPVPELPAGYLLVGGLAMVIIRISKLKRLG